MAELIGLTLLLLASGVCLLAYLVTLASLFPAWTARIAELADAHPRRAFWVGAVNLFFFGLIMVILLWLADGGRQIISMLALMLLMAGSGAISLGLSGIVRMVAARLYADSTAPLHLARSALWLIVACLLPGLGWLLLFPYLALLGLGSLILNLFRGAPKSVENNL